MRNLLAVVVAMGLAGCLAVPEKTWSEASHAPKAGDLVRVETRQGTRHIFRVYKTDETSFYGVATDNLKYRVPYGALKLLEVRQTELTWIALPIVGDLAATAIAGPILLGN